MKYLENVAKFLEYVVKFKRNVAKSLIKLSFKKESRPSYVTGSVDGEKNAIDSVNIISIGICFNIELTI